MFMLVVSPCFDLGLTVPMYASSFHNEDMMKILGVCDVYICTTTVTLINIAQHSLSLSTFFLTLTASSHSISKFCS